MRGEGKTAKPWEPVEYRWVAIAGFEMEPDDPWTIAYDPRALCRLVFSGDVLEVRLANGQLVTARPRVRHD